MQIEKWKYMKDFEDKHSLDAGTPVVIRVDGHAFRVFTRGMKVPFDQVFRKTMERTMLALCEFPEGCILGYTFSDEISLILKESHPELASPWHNFKPQKMASLSAAQATLLFNRFLGEEIEAYAASNAEDVEYIETMRKKVGTAIFDGRAFSLPEEELENYLAFRQQDCIRNSIHACARAVFKHKELAGKNGKDMREMLLAAGHPWKKESNFNQLGILAQKKVLSFTKEIDGKMVSYERGKWKTMDTTPVISALPEGVRVHLEDLDIGAFF